MILIETDLLLEESLDVDLIMSLCLGSDTCRGQGILGKLVVQTKTE